MPYDLVNEQPRGMVLSSPGLTFFNPVSQHFVIQHLYDDYSKKAMLTASHGDSVPASPEQKRHRIKADKDKRLSAAGDYINWLIQVRPIQKK